jgi:hypothetical protein
MIEPTLIDKMKSMSVKELEDHHNMSVTASRILNVAGIGTILLVLFFTNILSVCLAAISLYVLGQLAVGMDGIKELITDLLNQKHKINS